MHSEGWKRATAALWAWVDLPGEVTNVAAGPGGDGTDLRRWVHTRRVEYRQGLLSGDQITQLEELPGWSWGATPSQRWERCFTALAAAVAERGHRGRPDGPGHRRSTGGQVGFPAAPSPPRDTARTNAAAGGCR